MTGRREPIGGPAGAAAEALYGAAVTLRNRLYDRGLLPVHRVPLPVISVGNLIAGGTGKTPVAMEMIRILREEGARPALLTRGYGRENARRPLELPLGRRPVAGDHLLYGDEPCLYRARFPDLPIHLDRNRVRAGSRAAAPGAADILLLDDGMQHRRLHRDLDVILLPGRDPFRGNRLLPRGILREPPESIARGDLLLFDTSAGEDRDLQEHLDRAGAPRERIPFRLAPEALLGANGARLPLDMLRGAPVLAVSGVGDPDRFVRTLEEAGARVAARLDFPDHHRFEPADYATIREKSVSLGAIPVTTEKDRTRWDDGEAVRCGIRVLRAGLLCPDGGEEKIRRRLVSLLRGRS